MERERIKEENTDDDDTMEGNDDNVDDSIHEILSRHFESAVRNARKSVSDRDLAQYAYFAQTLQQSQATVTRSGGRSSVSFPFIVQTNSGNSTVGGVEESVEEEVEEKDPYSQIIHDIYSQIIYDANDATSDIFLSIVRLVLFFCRSMLLKEKDMCSGRSSLKGTGDTSKLNNI